MTQRARWERAALVAILLLSAAVRFHGITRQSLWADEALTWDIAKQPLGKLITRVIDDEQIPPIHHIVIHFWMKVFGDSEMSLRMPSLLAGVGSVWVMFLLVRRLGGPVAGLAAAAMMASSPLQIYYAHEARSYTLMMLLAALSCDLFLRLLREPTPKLRAAYVIASALMLYTHIYSVFVLLAQNVAWLMTVRRERTWKQWLTTSAAIAALFSPWIPVVISWMRKVEINFWVKKVTWLDVPDSYRAYAGSIALIILAAALAAYGVWRLRDRQMAVFLVALLVLPVLIPVIVSIARRPVYASRYGMVATIGLYALAACGVANLRWRSLQLLTVIALCALAPFARPVPHTKPQWHQAAEFLNREMRPGDFAAVNMKASLRLYDYYVHRTDVERRGFDGRSTGMPLTLPLRHAEQHVWLVLHPDIPAEPILARAPWQVLREVHWHQIAIYELAERPEPATTTTSPSPPAANPPPSASP